MNYFLWKAKIWLGRKFYRGFPPGVYRTGALFIVKRHSYVRYTEAATMIFIAAHTTIPVPRVHDFFVNQRGYLIMDFIDAPSLDTLWSSMTEDKKQSVLMQVQGYLRQLRQLVPPNPGYVEAVDGSSLFDPRQSSDPFGPFSSVQAFHKFLGHDFVLTSENYEQFHELFERCAKRSYRTVFSHGDLAPRNILVKDGRVVGIIDWETAGWYPEYLEYARLKRSNLDAPEWEERLCKLMDPYLDEESAEDALSSIFTRC
jgi:tRNA A-37 threonylcarbamoyl transferase component Bud32